MNTHKIKLKTQGMLTQLPDSQKLFGALMYLYSEYSEDVERTTNFVKKIRDKEIHLFLSNVTPNDYFPNPIDEFLGRLKNSTKEEYKFIKDRKYVKKEGLINLNKNPANACNVYPYIEIQESYQPRISIDSEKYNIPGLENQLFSVPQILIYEVKDSSGTKGLIDEFCFYIMVDDSEECQRLLKYIKRAQKEEKPFIRGQRSSQGFNTFQVESVDKFIIDYDKTSKFLNMGMLLPDQINYEESTLKLFTSERRPYESIGGWDKKFVSQIISFIAEGSIIVPSDTYDKTGKSINSPFDDGRAIVFGNSWLYPLDDSWKEDDENEV